MSKLSPVSGFVFLLAAAAFGPMTFSPMTFSPMTPAKAEEAKASRQRGSNAEITGAIDPRAIGPAKVAPADAAAIHAGVARMRFSEIRAAMDRRFLLHEVAPKTEIAMLDAKMNSLFDELAAIEQSPSADSASEARRSADDWYQASLQIVAPPAGGVTALPLPALMTKKAEAVATALDALVEQATANAAPPRSVELPKALPVRRRSVQARVPQAISQNEASLRLMRESLPLFLPIAGNLIQLSRQGDAIKK